MHAGSSCSRGFIIPVFSFWLWIFCTMNAAHAVEMPRQIDGLAIAEALEQVYDMLKNKKVHEIALDEELEPPNRPVAERYPDATIRLITDMPVDSVLAHPAVNLSVFFEGKEHLAAELWKISFERDGQQWKPHHFKVLLRADIGDHFTPQKSEVYKFNALTLQRDSMTFHISKGFLIPAFSGDTVGRVVIFGEGRFKFTPANGVERQQLNKYANNKGNHYTGTFTQMALLISPEGYRDIIDGVKLEQVKNNRVYQRAKDLLKRVEKDYVMKVKPTKSVWSFIPTSPEYLTAEFDMESSRNWLVYSYNPYELEEVSLAQKSGFPRNYRLKSPVMWCHFRKTGHHTSGKVDYPTGNALLHINRYTINGTLEKNKKTLNLKTTVDIMALEDSISVTSFVLNENLDIRRVDYDNGEAALVIQQGTFLSIPLLKTLNKGERTTLTFRYDGDIVQQPMPSFFTPLKNEEWLPRHSSRDAFHFDLEMRVPKSLKTVTTGVKVDERVEGDTSISRWQSTRPFSLLGVTFTEHRTITTQTGGVDVTLYADKELLKSASREDEILKLVDETLPFYSETFGKYPYEKLDIVQMPDTFEFGQGFPTLLMLWGLYFRSDYILDQSLSGNKYYNVKNFFQGFLAHELAHQWWGNVVVPRTYRDSWLAEGMATYAADLFIEKMVGKKQFLDMLKNHTEQARQADREGAIVLGYRLKEHYRPVVYEKSAMVLHMLRQVCGDEKFFTILSTFYNDSSRRLVTTGDFKKATEQIMKQDMTWFFDQWIYGTGFPRYRVDYTSLKQKDNRYRIQCTLSQEQEGRVFKMPVPIRVELKNGEMIETVIWSTSRYHSFEVIASDEVKRVKAAPDYSVYCETE